MVTILALLLLVALLMFRVLRKPKVIIVATQVEQENVVMGRCVNNPDATTKGDFDQSNERKGSVSESEAYGSRA